MRFDEVAQRDRFAEFRLSGEVTLSSLTEALRKVYAQCQSRGLNGALVDIRGAKGTLTVTERAGLVSTLVPEWNREIVLAMVLNAEQFLPSRFGQLAAQNRGVRTLEFRDRDQAAAWLVSALADPTLDVPVDLI